MTSHAPLITYSIATERRIHIQFQRSQKSGRVKPSDLSRTNHTKNPTINVYIRFSHIFSRFPLMCSLNMTVFALFPLDARDKSIHLTN